MVSPGQTITSLEPGTGTADSRRILIIAAGDAATPTPVPPDPLQAGYPVNADGIVHLELRDDDPAANPWTTGDFVLWTREPNLSDEWRAGATFVWNVAAAADGYRLSLNVQGAALVWLQMTAKGTPAGAASIWGGTNTVPGA